MGGEFEEIKKDFKSIFKHLKKVIKSLFKSKDNDDCCCSRKNCYNKGCGFNNRRPNFWRYPPFFNMRSPWMIIFYPKIMVAIILILALLFCGVSLYGLLVIILLTLLFILI